MVFHMVGRMLLDDWYVHSMWLLWVCLMASMHSQAVAMSPSSYMVVMESQLQIHRQLNVSSD